MKFKFSKLGKIEFFLATCLATWMKSFKKIKNFFLIELILNFNDSSSKKNSRKTLLQNKIRKKN